MSATVVKVIPKAGTTYGVDDTGAIDIVQRYQVILDEPLNSGQLLTSFNGVPAIGTVHPQRAGYYASRYEIRQPDGADRATLDVSVHYSAQVWSTDGGGGDVTMRVDEWGWDSSTSQRELLCDTDGNTVLNSAGDSFDQYPQIETPAPVFTKVMRFNSRQPGWYDCNCKVNSSAVTISGRSFPKGTLLCTISENLVIGAIALKYRYTVHLRYRSNPAKIAGAETLTECGWDEVIADAGMRSKDETSGRLVLIKIPDSETGEPATVTSPELLDGAGKPVARSADPAWKPTPYNFRVKAYAEANFPNWFYSEP